MLTDTFLLLSVGNMSNENRTDTDPKKQAGSVKTPLALIPPVAAAETAWVHQLGAIKYGAFNWRDTGVYTMTYAHAMMRHLDAWRDGEDNDPESGRSHLAHIACCCNILLDAAACDKLTDDRPLLSPND